jgi:hypothetical protein
MEQQARELADSLSFFNVCANGESFPCSQSGTERPMQGLAGRPSVGGVRHASQAANAEPFQPVNRAANN